MRILHVIASLDKTQGGPPPVVTGMCAALAARGHDVSLYANQSLQPFLEPEAASFRLAYFPVDWSPFQVSWAMERQLRELDQFDIVHTHMLYRFPQAAAAWHARRQGVPYCVQPHGALAPNVFYGKRRLGRKAYVEAIERRNLVKASGLIFTTPQELSWASELNMTPARTFIVPVGAEIRALSRKADPQAFRSRHGIGDKKLVLWMGRMVESKGLAMLVTAFAHVLKERGDIVLALCGPDTNGFRSSLERLVAELDIHGQVVFTGMIEGEHKQEAFCAADLFVLPSDSENFGLAALEALATGCPVLLSPGVSLGADVVAAGAGLIAPRDTQQWTGKILDIMQDEPGRYKMALAAQTFAWRYDWSHVVCLLEDAYRAMMARQ